MHLPVEAWRGDVSGDHDLGNSHQPGNFGHGRLDGCRGTAGLTDRRAFGGCESRINASTGENTAGSARQERQCINFLIIKKRIIYAGFLSTTEMDSLVFSAPHMGPIEYSLKPRGIFLLTSIDFRSGP